MRSHDLDNEQQNSVHPHTRLIPLPIDTYPDHPSHAAAVHDLYSAFFPSFPDPVGGMSVAAYPYSLPVGGPVDMSMSLQQSLMQLDATDTIHLRDLSESYAPIINIQHEHQCSSPVHTQSPQSQQNNTSYLQSNGHAHTMLPPMIQPNPNDLSMQFDSEVRINPFLAFLSVVLSISVTDPHIQPTYHEYGHFPGRPTRIKFPESTPGARQIRYLSCTSF
jgi:hypothetical protein